MTDDTGAGSWFAWLGAEIASCEVALFVAAPDDRIEIWRRLDLLHALHDEPPATRSTD